MNGHDGSGKEKRGPVRLSDDERQKLREAGLCFRCKGKYERGHICPDKSTNNAVCRTNVDDEKDDWIFRLSRLCDECEMMGNLDLRCLEPKEFLLRLNTFFTLV